MTFIIHDGPDCIIVKTNDYKPIRYDGDNPVLKLVPTKQKEVTCWYYAAAIMRGRMKIKVQYLHASEGHRNVQYIFKRIIEKLASDYRKHSTNEKPLSEAYLRRQIDHIITAASALDGGERFFKHPEFDSVVRQNPQIKEIMYKNLLESYIFQAYGFKLSRWRPPTRTEIISGEDGFDKLLTELRTYGPLLATGTFSQAAYKVADLKLIPSPPGLEKMEIWGFKPGTRKTEEDNGHVVVVIGARQGLLDGKIIRNIYYRDPASLRHNGKNMAFATSYNSFCKKSVSTIGLPLDFEKIPYNNLSTLRYLYYNPDIVEALYDPPS